ncbi:MAG: hypothetical protein JXA69_01465 [Phycisphaerae bacterium]|nr:hypothetical protein [Phycisphaerae bacterium]
MAQPTAAANSSASWSGADSINDEIAAHKTGATFIGDRLLKRRSDTIFEIGSQDSKDMSLQPEGKGSLDTVVVDFTMNEARAVRQRRPAARARIRPTGSVPRPVHGPTGTLSAQYRAPCTGGRFGPL